jgi:hypothetical protein
MDTSSLKKRRCPTARNAVVFSQTGLLRANVLIADTRMPEEINANHVGSF